MIDEGKLLSELIDIGESIENHIIDADNNGEKTLDFMYKNQLAMLKKVISRIRKQPKIGEWILYSERRPPDPEGEIPETREELENAFISDSIKEYIVMLEGATEPTTFFYGGDDRWYDPCGCLKPCRVIAWQPLPEPYKGEERKEV